VRAHISGKKVEATPAQLSFPFPHAGEWLKALSNVQALYAGGPFDFASRHQRERDEDIQGDPDRRGCYERFVERSVGTGRALLEDLVRDRLKGLRIRFGSCRGFRHRGPDKIARDTHDGFSHPPHH